jgi:hypothetical protein
MDYERATREVATATARFEKALTESDEDFMVLMTVMGAVMVETLLAVTKNAVVTGVFIDNMHEQVRRWELQNRTSVRKC